jgi:molybdopterin/thiamine biosynthesis adenylyltransferase/proteasome lid subunit RPN8/RPN11
MRLLGRELHHVPGRAYERRDPDALRIRSDGWVPALRRAAEIGATPVWIHTHPDGKPIPSRHDDTVDTELFDPFTLRAETDTYASVVLSPSDTGFSFTGRITTGEEWTPLTRVHVIGNRICMIGAYDVSDADALPSMFDRQIRAFGGDVQRAVSRVTVGVAGCGGTGSAVAEQLVRLGVRNLILSDPDTLTDTNTTRVYGSRPDQAGESKPHVLAAHLTAIAPDLNVTTVTAGITHLDAARVLASADVVFGCTDDNAGRLVLSRIASYLLIPVFDCGVLVDSTDGRLKGVHGRVTVMSPGAACLVCRGRIDLARAAAEQMSETEHRRLAGEGYAPELGDIDPAVIPYTTIVAATAVAELLERLIGYGPDDVPSELLLRLHDRALSTNSRHPNEGHYCDPVAGTLGVGDTDPFLGQTWA